MRAGANLPAVGGYNQTVILDAVRRATEGVSRVEVAERTGLSAQTVSNVCRRLIDDGLIVEAGTHIAGVGKPRTMLKLEPRGRFAIGVHLDPSAITVVLLDLAGTVIAHRTIDTSDTARSSQTIRQIVRVVGEVTAETALERGRLIGVGVAAPGPVDLESGTVLNPPLLAGWENVPVRDALAERLGLPVLLEKDVTAAAVAELWTRLDPERENMAFFYYGTGVGVGLVLQNEVIRGFSSNSGDIGHLFVDGALDDLRRSGPTPRQLGDAVMPRYLVRAAIDGGVVERDSLSGTTDGTSLETTQVRRLFLTLAAAAHSGDPVAVELLDGVARDIASGLVSVINLLDIRHVIFGGPFWNPVGPFLLERIPQLVLASRMFVPPHSVTFAGSTIGEDVAAVGAACLVLDHAFSPRPAGLLIQRSL